MQVNVGNTDRNLRLISGFALLSLLFWVEGPTKWLGLLGLVYLFTGFTRWCFAYSWLGINTCSAKPPAKTE